MVRLHLLLSLAGLPALSAIALLQGMFDRARFDKFAQSEGLPRVEWAPDLPSASLGVVFFEWLEQAASTGEPSVLATPRLSVKQAAALARIPSASLSSVDIDLQPLAAAAPSPGVLFAGGGGAVARGAAPLADAQLVEQCMRAWVNEALSPSGLGLCPFTQSDEVAAVRLEAQGVNSAPILHCCSAARTPVGLLADCWRAIEQMIERGEEGCSSIILSAPAWDDEWEEWREVIFPLLEESVLATELSRTLGVVCFHPQYETPPPEFLARHRFGHMHATDTLRGWLQKHEAPLSEGLDDAQLSEAAAFMRRSPHAMINVLWSRQLEAAELKRKSSQLPIDEDTPEGGAFFKVYAPGEEDDVVVSDASKALFAAILALPTLLLLAGIATYDPPSTGEVVEAARSAAERVAMDEMTTSLLGQ